MKNLFKNLMLVAVAAMAFTSCSQDVNELNKLEKKTTIEFVASFDGDTRSGFTGSSEDENGTVMYHSEWFGGETVMLVAGDQVVTAIVDTEGKFSATFEGEVSQINIYTPMDSFYKPYMDYNIYQVNPEVLAEQTPLANSVDPKAHVAEGYVMVDVDGNQTIPVSLMHDVAYGKMTVKGVDFDIDHVVIDLKGSYYGDKNYTYTLNADNVENNTFWFATEPIEVAEFTVTAYDAEGNAVTKSVDVAAAGKTLAFNYGRVSTFSVSGLETPTVPAFTSAYASGYNYNDFYLYFEDETYNLATLKLNPGAICNADWIMTTGEYQLGVYPGIYAHYSMGYSTYGGVSLATGTVKIDIVDKKYHFEFINLADFDGNVLIEKATYVGSVTGLNVPDPRTPLATPEAEISVVGKTVTITWADVTGANSYRVYCVATGESYEQTETTITLEMPEYSTYYEFQVTAVASDSNPDYKSSNVYYCGISTEMDPNVTITKYTSMYFVEEMITYPMYNEYCNVFELSNGSGERMTLYVGSKQSTSTYIQVGDYSHTSVDNLGYQNSVFQAKAYTAAGEYVGQTTWNSTMNVKRDGDVYDINIVMVTSDGDKYFFNCNAPIGVQQQPVALETPVVSSSVNGNEVVVNWSAINGAANYTVTLGSQSQTVNDTTVTFSNLEYETTYTVSVVANPADTTANLASAAGTSSFTTEADPNTGGGSDTGEGETTVPEGYIELNQCIYYGDLYGAGLADEYVLLSADGKNKLFFNINNATTDSNYIPTGEYTIASVGSIGYTFNMSTISDTTYINGQAYGNGVADNSSSTMSVVSEGKGGIHEIKLTINNNQGTNKFYFKGTIN